MNPILKKALQYGISLALTALFLYLAFQGIDLNALWIAMKRTSFFWIVIMMSITVGTVVLRGWRWIVLMRPFAPQVKLMDASLALSMCYAANFVFPRSGEALRALSLKWKRDAPLAPVLATVVVERILDLIWLVVFIGMALFIQRERINAAFPTLEPYALLVLAGCLLTLAALALISIFRERALRLVERFLTPISQKLATALTHHLGTFLQGLTALHNPAAYVEIIVSSLLLNFGYVLIIYSGLISFGFAGSEGLGLSAALVVMAISSIGVIIPTPGAIGPYHYFFKESLNLLYQIPAAEALACATVVHAFSNLTYFIVGVPALILQRRKQDGKKGESPPVPAT